MVAMGVSGLFVPPVLVPALTLYRCENVRASTFPVRLNLGFSNAYRAPGVMEGSFGFEQAIDELAEALGIDPLELRRRNGVELDQASGLPYTSKGLDQAIDRAAELAGWVDRDALAAEPGPDGRRRGLGAACQIWWGGGGPPAHALVRLGADGLATVVTGTQDIGTGIDHGARAGRGRGARPVARPRSRRDGHDPLRRLLPGLGRLADDPVDGAGGTCRLERRARAGARPGVRPLRGLGRRPRPRRRRDREPRRRRCASRSPR